MFSKFKWRWWWWKFTATRKIKEFSSQYSILKYGIILFLGAFFVIFSGMLIWEWVLWSNEDVGKVKASEPIHTFHWHRLYEIDTFGQVLASPLVTDLDEVLGKDVLIANSSGAVYGFTGRDGNLLYQFSLDARIVASPLLVKIGIEESSSGELVEEPLVIDETGTFYALSINSSQIRGANNDYLYRSRTSGEQFGSKIFGKPAYGVVTNDGVEQGMIIVAGGEGRVASYESLYGRLVWTNDTSFRREEDIFTSPVVLLEDSLETETVILASTLGTVVGLAVRDGTPLWRFQVTNEAAKVLEQADGVRGAMNVGDFVPQHDGKEIALLTYKGQGLIFSAQGSPFCSFYTKGFFISSLGKGKFYTSENPLSLLAISTEGQFYTILPNVVGKNVACRVNVFTERQSANFIVSPVIEDFNLDGISDVLIASRQGELFLINGKDGKDLLPPLALGYALTATPAVADLTGDGSLEIVVAGENGTVTVLSLFTTPAHVFKPYQDFSTMFLKNVYNHN